MIAEEIPSRNKGEAAILFGFLDLLKKIEREDINFSMFTFDKNSNDFNKEGIELVSYLENISNENEIIKFFTGIYFFIKLMIFSLFYSINRNLTDKLFTKEIWRVYSNADIVLVGHDGLLESLGSKTSKKHENWTFFFTYCSIFIYKILMKKKVIILAASIGAYSSAFIRKIAKISLNYVDLITLRDSKSYNYLETLNIKKPFSLTADLAFLMKPEPSNNLLLHKELTYLMNLNNIVGMTISNQFSQFRFPEIDSIENKYKEHLVFYSQVIDYIIEKYDSDIVLISHAIKKDKDDRMVYYDLLELINHKNKVHVLSKEYTPQLLKTFIGLCNIFIGERTHSNVAAVSMGVPTIVISEPNSFRNSMFNNILEDEFICDISKIEITALYEKIDKLIEMRDLYRNNILVKMGNIMNRSLENGKFLLDIVFNE